MTPDNSWFDTRGGRMPSLGVQLNHTLKPERFAPLTQQEATRNIQTVLSQVPWLTNITPNSGGVIHLSARVTEPGASVLADPQMPIEQVLFHIENGRFAHSRVQVPQKILGMCWPQYRSKNMIILAGDWRNEMVLVDFYFQIAAHLGILHIPEEVEDLVYMLTENETAAQILHEMHNPVLEEYRWPLYQFLNRSPAS